MVTLLPICHKTGLSQPGNFMSLLYKQAMSRVGEAEGLNQGQHHVTTAYQASKVLCPPTRLHQGDFFSVADQG